jgi:DNA-3-methyladenine glycosylase
MISLMRKSWRAGTICQPTPRRMRFRLRDRINKMNRIQFQEFNSVNFVNSVSIKRDSALHIPHSAFLCYAGRVQKLPRAFYGRDTVTVARELLGKHLVHVVNGDALIGRIVEVEAYIGPHDLASHSSRGLTERTKIMFGPPGHAYVYLIYGMHHCMNVVTDREGHGAAVLLRAVEPINGIEARTQGPGLLCRAMQIDRALNACDLLGDKCFIAAPKRVESFGIAKSPRIGVDYARHWARRHLRFHIKGNPFVSRID